MLILPGTDTASANKTLEKLRLVVANHEWLLRQLTVSIGLASADLFDDKKQLLEVADQMLYKAKTQGRIKPVCSPHCKRSVHAALISRPHKN